MSRLLTAALGSGQTSVTLRSRFEDVFTGPVALLGLAEDGQLRFVRNVGSTEMKICGERTDRWTVVAAILTP